MKISKNNTPINASINIPDSKYAESIEYIKSAISALGAVAKDDNIAKEAIANLSVILLDLQ